MTWAGGALFAGSPDERFEAGFAMLLDGIERSWLMSETMIDVTRHTYRATWSVEDDQNVATCVELRLHPPHCPGGWGGRAGAAAGGDPAAAAMV